MNENTPRSDDASTKASQMRDTVRDKAASFAQGAKDQVNSQYDRQKEVATGELDRLAGALRRAGDELNDNSGISGKVISGIADRVESFSRSLNGKDLGTVLNDFDRFAHRNPAAFLGGAVAIGFLASRFLKSSGRGMHTGSDFYSEEAYGGHFSGGTDAAIGSAGYRGGTGYDGGTVGSGTYGGGGGTRTGASSIGSTGGSMGGSAGGSTGSDFSTGGSGIGTTSGSGMGTTGSGLGTTGSGLGSTGNGLGASGSGLGAAGNSLGTGGSSISGSSTMGGGGGSTTTSLEDDLGKAGGSNQTGGGRKKPDPR